MLNVEKIRSFLEKKQPKNHPILEHPLEQQEEYVQMLYIDILCIFAQYENAGITAALNFVQRLMAGLNLTEPVTDHMKEAMELSVERFEEFIVQCQEQRLEDIFLLDAMMLSCAAGTPKKKQLEFLALTADALRLRKSRVEWLSKLTRVILEQDSVAYHELCYDMPDEFCDSFLPSIVCYLKQFVIGALVDTEEMLYLYAPEKTSFDLIAYFGTESDSKSEKIPAFTSRTVIFENLVLETDLSRELFSGLTFHNNSNVQFYNCEFLRYHFCFETVKKIRFTSCDFSSKGELKYSLISLGKGTAQITIDSCVICDIDTRGDDSRYALISGEDDCRIYVEKTRFENIGKIVAYYRNCVLIYKGKICITDCQFINCPSTNCGTLFDYSCKIEKNENCTFLNCAPLT